MNDAERRRALFVLNPALPRTGRDFGRRLLELAGELGWEAMVLETAAGLNVEAIGAALEHKVRKVTDGLTGLRVVTWPVRESNWFQNVNTPQEWRQYRNG